MKKPQRLDLIWEQSHNHKSAFCKDMEKSKLGEAIPMLMRRLALAKMTDVTLISGDFDESFQMFYPQLSLLFNHNYYRSLEFFGVYTSDFLYNYFSDFTNHEEDESIDEPCFCIRRVTWDKLDIKKVK